MNTPSTLAEDAAHRSPIVLAGNPGDVKENMVPVPPMRGSGSGDGAFQTPVTARTVMKPQPSLSKGSTIVTTESSDGTMPKRTALARAKQATAEPLVTVDLTRCAMTPAAKIHDDAFELAETVPTMVLFQKQRRFLFRGGMPSSLGGVVLLRLDHVLILPLPCRLRGILH
jgi:hypothetical protein